MAVVCLTADRCGTRAIGNAGVLLLVLGVFGVLGCAAFHPQFSPLGPAVPAAAAVARGGVTAPASPWQHVEGFATFYAGDFQGRIMAGGGVFDMNDAGTTASNRWPLGTMLRVRRVAGGPWDATLSMEQRSRYFGASILVTVRDRGAFTHELDLSRAAFALLGRTDEGVIRVAVEPVDGYR
jgi:hypothetical protein